jgi:glycine C-acetyltransferase
LSIVIYPVIQRYYFIENDSYYIITLSDVDETLTALEIREKLENGTYKEIASRTTVDLDA